MRKLIINGDDFGLAVPVNEAIEEAHRSGILTSASLMVGAKSAADAVDRAKRLPSLRVGLHLVLVHGLAVLPKSHIPDLVDEQGEFLPDPILLGLKYFFQRELRPQLEAEIRAQFQAFYDTGLRLDHVNGHMHFHLHPGILEFILKIGKDFGLRAMRLPYEPPVWAWRASRKGLFRKIGGWAFLLPWIALLKTRLKWAGIRYNDFLFGLSDTGHLDREILLQILRRLPRGVTEIYCHPATRRCAELDRAMPEYRHELEFEALTSHLVKQAIAASGSQPIGFSQL
ncbi:hopanoid biosynthesis-associated protein HpnK [Nitrospira sp. Nam74]